MAHSMLGCSIFVSLPDVCCCWVAHLCQCVWLFLFPFLLYQAQPLRLFLHGASSSVSASPSLCYTILSHIKFRSFIQSSYGHAVNIGDHYYPLVPPVDSNKNRAKRMCYNRIKAAARQGPCLSSLAACFICSSFNVCNATHYYL